MRQHRRVLGYTQGGSDDGDPRTFIRARLCGKYFLRSRAKTCFVGRNLSRRYRHPKLHLPRENSIATPHPPSPSSLVRSAPIFSRRPIASYFDQLSSRSVTFAGSSRARVYLYSRGIAKNHGKPLARGFNGMIDDG